MFDDIQAGKFALTEETRYPYHGSHAPCVSRAGLVTGVLYKHISADHLSFINAVQKGVLSIAIDASSFVFQHYQSGIIDDGSCYEEGLNHGVSAVGFGKSNETFYAIIRNSWGKWGESGYARVQIYPKDVCGVLKEVVLVTDVTVLKSVTV